MGSSYQNHRNVFPTLWELLPPLYSPRGKLVLSAGSQPIKQNSSQQWVMFYESCVDWATLMRKWKKNQILSWSWPWWLLPSGRTIKCSYLPGPRGTNHWGQGKTPFISTSLVLREVYIPPKGAWDCLPNRQTRPGWATPVTLRFCKAPGCMWVGRPAVQSPCQSPEGAKQLLTATLLAWNIQIAGSISY